MKSLLYFGVVWAAFASSAYGSVQLGETVPWDLTLRNSGFTFYETHITSPAIEHMQAVRSSSGWKVTKRLDRCYKNPEWMTKTKNPFFLYPLFGGVEVEKWNLDATMDWYRAKKGSNNPYFPIPHTGPEVEFFSEKLPTSMPDFLKLVHGDHWIYLPPDSKKITVEQTPISEVHPDFEFPNGTILVHRLYLNDEKQTPLEWRYLQKVANRWAFGVYEVSGDVDPSHPQYTLTLRRGASGTMKRVLRHRNLAYGDLEFSYPVASAQIYFERERILDGRIRTISTSTCITCHSEGTTFLGRPDLRLAMLKDMQAKIQIDQRPSDFFAYLQSLREERKYLQKKKAEAEAAAKSSALSPPESPKKKAEQKKTLSTANTCDELTTYSAEELAGIALVNTTQSSLEEYRIERRKDLSDYHPGNGERKQLWETVTYRSYPLGSLMPPSSKPCGFSPPHPDNMDVQTDLDGFKKRYQEKFKKPAFEYRGWKNCSARKVKVGDVVSVNDSRVWDQLRVQRISFEVTQINGSRIEADALNKNEFLGLKLIMNVDSRDGADFQLVFPDKEDPYFALTDAGVLGLPHQVPTGSVRSILCRGVENLENTAGHVTMENFPTMDNPAEQVAGNNFAYGMWTQNFGATRGFDPLRSFSVFSPSHGMASFGRTFLNGWAVRGQVMGTLDQVARGNYANPLSAGEWSRQLQLYRNEVHKHASILGLEAQLGKRWGAENQNSFFLSTGPVGRGPVGPDFESMTPAGQFQRPADDHHATRVFHTIRSPITGTLQLGAMGQPRWLIQAGVYKVANAVPSDARLGYPAPDSYGFRIERTLPSKNGKMTQKFGLSAASQNSIHELPTHGEAPHSEDGEKTKSDREFYGMGYHELQRAFSETARLAIMNIVAHQRKLETGANLMTFSNQTNLRYGRGSKNVLFGGFRVRQMSADEWEIEPYSVDPTKPVPESMPARSYNVGVGRQVFKKQGSEVFATVEYQGSWVPNTLLDAKTANWAPHVAHRPGSKRVDQVTFNVWVYIRKGHKH